MTCLSTFFCSRTTWQMRLIFVMNHAPGIGLIARPVGQHSRALPLFHGYPNFHRLSTHDVQCWKEAAWIFGPRDVSIFLWQIAAMFVPPQRVFLSAFSHGFSADKQTGVKEEHIFWPGGPWKTLSTDRATERPLLFTGIPLVDVV